MRPTKETHKGDLQKKPFHNTKKDLQKRPTQETHKRDPHNTKETNKKDPQKRPAKETLHNTQKRTPQETYLHEFAACVVVFEQQYACETRVQFGAMRLACV